MSEPRELWEGSTTTLSPVPGMDRGLPANIDAERFILGSIMMDADNFIQASVALNAEDFSLEKHRRIWYRMTDIAERGDRIDRVTLANELMNQNQLESVDGLSYLVSLDDGLPRISNLDGYIRIVKDKSYKRQLIFQSQRIIDRAMLQGDEDSSSLLKGAAEEILTIADKATVSESGPVSLARSVESMDIEALCQGRRGGMPTGFLRFDALTGGLHKGEVTILAARPSMGKTAMALNIGLFLGKRGSRGAIFSLEMTRQSLITRLLVSEARVDNQKLAQGFLNPEERRRIFSAALVLGEIPISIDDTSTLSLAELRLKLRQFISQGGLDWVMIDYLGLMKGAKSENRTQEIGGLSRGIKQIAKDLNISMVVLCQLSRSADKREDHRPQLADLRESGDIEQDADVVAFIYREEVYKPDREDLRGMAELILAKQRNGPTGKCSLVFLKEYARFENMMQDFEPE